jgi:nitronate monooxygenase
MFLHIGPPQVFRFMSAKGQRTLPQQFFTLHISSATLHTSSCWPMNDLLIKLGIEHPVIQAPMGGGPGTPALAAAVSNAGGLGSLAGAYLTPDQIRDEVKRTRELTTQPFNVNLFAGGYQREADRDAAPMLEILRPIHELLHIAAPSLPSVPPDPFDLQLAAILEMRPHVFSFTFGVPATEVLRTLRRERIVVLGTATTREEASILEEAGVDGIVAQGSEAGAHRGTFAGSFEEAMIPTLELVRQIAARSNVAVIASGGIMTGAEIAAALRAGASAVQLGTAFLSCPEAGTSPPYRRAILDAGRDDTVITRAFSGRPARGLRNRFTEAMAAREELILPFPIQNSLTRIMRSASATLDTPDYLSLWVGTGVGRARAMPAAKLIATLMEERVKSEG